MSHSRFIIGGTFSAIVLGSAGALSTACAPMRGQWTQTHEQRYLPGPYNWQFRRYYPAADRLFNAFDYGHAILYETLWTKPSAPASELEVRRYLYLTREVLVHPPRLPLEEAAVEPEYAKLAPEAKQMFDWAHVLHRQIYDVWGDERIPASKKDVRVAELLRYYKTRPDLAFSSKPKSMDLMEGQPYSLAFRQKYPKFNGLIWAYHWLQVGLYEPLLLGANRDERQTGIVAAVARFRQMIEDAPTWMPRVMPMTAAVAPTFAARYPEAAIIFDNLHSMHDVVSDILANPSVPRERKRDEILLAARRYRDDTSFVTSEQEWRDMAMHMGVQNMGGPVTGVLEPFPTPTVERGARMADIHAQAAGSPTHAHDQAAPTAAAPGAAADHAGHQMPAAQTTRPSRTTAPSHQQLMNELHQRLMADPVIHQRILADTVLHGLMKRTMTSAAQPAAVSRPAARRATPATRRTTRRTPARQPAATPQPARPDSTRREPAHKH